MSHQIANPILSSFRRDYRTARKAYVLYLVLSWLPRVPGEGARFSITQMAQIGASVYALSALTCVLTGRVSDHWLTAGASSNRVRKTALLSGFAGIAVYI